MSSRTRAIVLINPNNPTGAVYPRELLEKLVAIARRHNLLLLVDEIYDQVLYDGAKFEPLAPIADDHPCITFSGLSKVHRACGWRVGWAILTGAPARTADYRNALDLLSGLRLCANVAGQYAIAAAVNGPDTISELCSPGGRLYETRRAVVEACAPFNVPVTLKMRTGWCQQHKNAVSLARQFESIGIQMLTVHGRTREQGYKGQAEYDTIAAVKAAVKVPVVANGDITSPEKARDVLAYTGADAIMIGRAAQGRPWIFREIGHFLDTGEHLAPPLVAEVRRLLLDHLQDHYSLYGELTGVRSARKHIAWYLRALPGGEAFRQHINTIEDSAAQWQAVADFLDALGSQMDRMPAATAALANTEEQEGLPA